MAIPVFVTTYLPRRPGAIQRAGMCASVLGWWLDQQDRGHVRVTLVAVRDQPDVVDDMLAFVRTIHGAVPTHWDVPGATRFLHGGI